MREYGQIQSAFWQAPDIQAMSDPAKLLAALLLTGPATNGIGCFAMGNGALADLLGWAAPFAEERFAELSRNGFAYRFGTVVFIPNFLRWNRIANGNVAKARFQEWEQVPRGPLKGFAARAMLTFSDFWAADHKTVLETVCQTVSGTVITEVENQNPTQPNPIQIPPKHSPSKVAVPKIKGVPERFEEFWKRCPRKVGKGDAIKAFGKLSPEDAQLAIDAMPRHAVHWQARGTEDQFIPHPSTWLNDMRWLDEIPNVQRQPTAKPSRQASILQTLAEDDRYDRTARSHLATDRDSSGLCSLNGVVASLPAGRDDD